MSRRFRLCLVLLCCLAAGWARAQLTIEIVGGGATAIPISIVPFAGENAYPLSVTQIVSNDLARSGLFKMIDGGGVNPRPARAEDVRFADWTARGADAVVVGSAAPLPDGRVEVRFFLLDAVKQSLLTGFTYAVPPSQLRPTAHRIADVIYEKLTGDRGVFSTRIAYVAKQGTRYDLFVAEADGFNPQSVVSSNEPLLSPVWSPDGTRIAYVSLENKKPVIYVQSLQSGARQVVANFRGSNSAPAWSPDGGKLAVTLSKDGSSQLYLVNTDGSGVQRVMNSAGHRHRGELCPRWTVDPVYLGSRGQPADLSAHAGERRGGAHHLRRQLQRVTPPPARQQGIRLRASRRQPLQHRDPGLRDSPGAGSDAGRARRIAERRAQRQADHLRVGGGGAWYIGRRLKRWSCQAAIDRGDE